MLWSVVVKYAARHLPAEMMSFIGISTSLVVVTLVAMRGPSWPWHPAIFLSMLGGILGAVSSLALYAALRTGPVSVVIPTAELYIGLSAVAGWMLLAEPINVRRGLGIVCSLIAVVLLVGKK